MKVLRSRIFQNNSFSKFKYSLSLYFFFYRIYSTFIFESSLEIFFIIWTLAFRCNHSVAYATNYDPESQSSRHQRLSAMSVGRCP